MWKTVKHLFWEWRGVAIAAPTVTGIVLLLRMTGLLQAWEWSAYDQYMRLRPQDPVDDRVVIVGINEADVKAIGQAIIPDRIYAELITKLKTREPRAIGLDVYRDLPVEPGHAALVDVFESTPNLIGIQKVVGERGWDAVAPPPALKAKGQVAANDLVYDADDRVRRGFVSVSGDDGEKVYSFSLYAALLYLKQEEIAPRNIEDQVDTWQLGQTMFTPFTSYDGGYVAADAGGYQLLINYRGGRRKFQTVSLMDVLEDRLPADWGRDRVILIGAVGESFRDVMLTPYSGSFLGLSEFMAGVEVHANLTSQFISAAMDGRPLIKSWSEPWEWLWILGWAGVGATLAWQMRHVTHARKYLILRISIPILAAAVLLSSTFAAFVAGWWIPIVPAMLAMAGTAVSITSFLAYSAGKIRKTFGRYLTDEIVANLLESPKGLSLGGERREITILTSDLRGFTATSERLPPEEVIKVINFYLGHMADIITQYQGTIDEFMGDGILVLFGAPTQRSDDAERAIACAVAMQLAMTEVNQTVKAWGLAPLEMGIGINTGEVVVGNIGSEKRTKYGVMGSQVNLTYRIESYTTPGQVLISESTLKAAGAIVQVIDQKEVKPKGVQNPLQIYDVGGITGAYNLYLPQEEEVFVPLPTTIPVIYTELSGKHVGEVMLQGWLVQLSAKGALLKLDDPNSAALPEPLSNLKLNFLPWGDQTTNSDDVYAKVLDRPADPGGCYILFTAKPPAVATQLETLYQTLTG
ncbi:CHASE2 domain-containing protein [Pantanalinema rosaneae CENA516]|uniref:CHASE2 domain-containing protein n=1 Tax=Pantanalinema rosaneae TaxID=1620701 RepID=UPI003D6E4DEB